MENIVCKYKLGMIVRLLVQLHRNVHVCVYFSLINIYSSKRGKLRLNCLYFSYIQTLAHKWNSNDDEKMRLTLNEQQKNNNNNEFSSIDSKILTNNKKKIQLNWTQSVWDTQFYELKRSRVKPYRVRFVRNVCFNWMALAYWPE